MNSILEVNGLVVSRSGKQVLDIEYLPVIERETLVVIGPNGAGKSTLMLVIAQLIKPDRGEIVFRGQNLLPADALNFRRQTACSYWNASQHEFLKVNP